MNERAIRLTITLSFFMEMLDSTILNTSLPQMALSLHQEPLHLKMALTSYLLSLGIFIPISGWLADRYGTRTVFAWAMVLFTLGSLCCAVATTLPFLVAARIVQGIGGAMMTPVGRLVILQVFDRQKIAHVMSHVTTIAMIAPMLGPVLGGLLTTYLSWRFIFLVNLPFGVIGLWAVFVFIPQIKRASGKPFDWRGFVLIGSALCLLLWGFQHVMDERGSRAQIIELVLGLILLLSYVVYMMKVPHAVISRVLFSQRIFSIMLAGGFVSRLGLAVPFVLPLLFQLGRGYNAFIAGLMMLPFALGVMLVKPFSVWLFHRFGYRTLLLVNTPLLGAIVLSFVCLTFSLPWWCDELWVFAFGLSMSLNFGTGNTLMYAEVESHLKSQSTSLGMAMQQVCISFGIAIAALVLQVSAQAHDLSHSIPLPAFRVTFLVMGVFILLATPIYHRLKPTDGEGSSGHR